MKKKTIIILSISILTVLIIFIGSSYALFSKTQSALNKNEYQTGVLQIEYSSDSTLTINPIPMTDANGEALTPYIFTITNTGTLDYQYDLKLLTDSTYVASHGCANNQTPAQYIKVKLDDSEPVLLSNLTSGTIISDETLAAGASKTYNLRMWLDISSPNSIIGSHFHGKIVSEGEAIYTELNKPNAPVLASGMIPIKYDGTKWVKADTSNTNNSWYNYDNKEWANAVMVTSGTRDTYMNASAGTTISEEDILAYYVWIPRYKYQLFNVDSTTIDPIEIQIKFENGTPTKSSGTTNDEWLTHPAFTLGTDELKGIWVGKFSTTGSAETPTIKPNIGMLANQNVSTQFTTSQIFGTTTYLTSTGVSEVDAHMMKNIEWGAVAYLKQSKYGLGTTDIGLNNYDSSPYLTGCGSTSGSAYSTTCNAYNTTDGMLASTTGNITGIYDMSAYTGTYVMGVMQDNTGTNTPMSGYNSSYNSGFTGKIYDSGNFTDFTGTPFPNTKYYDLYAYGTSNSDYTRRILGDATGEVHGWYGDIADFVNSDGPWFFRGGGFVDPADAGVFSFYYNAGWPAPLLVFRSVLAPGA